MNCPKCNGPMRSYERNNVTIDQCSECRGVFLDRGELERLIDAEGNHYSSFSQPEVREQRYDDDRRHDDDHHRGGHHKKKRHGFLSELFDD